MYRPSYVSDDDPLLCLDKQILTLIPIGLTLNRQMSSQVSHVICPLCSERNGARWPGDGEREGRKDDVGMAVALGAWINFFFRAEGTRLKTEI